MKSTTRTLFCLYLFFIIICGTCETFAQKFKPKYIRENDKTLLALTTNATNDGWIEFRQDKPKINPNTFFELYGSALGLDKSYRLKVVKDKADVKQNQHQRYQFFYKNIPVEGADYSLHFRADGLRLAHGRIPDGLAIDVDKAMFAN